MTIVSLNCTSLDANMPALQHLAQVHSTAVLALQETRHSHHQMDTLRTAAASPDNGSWRCSWGACPPRGRVRRKARGGGTDHTVPAASAVQGGVGILAQGALVDTTRDDPQVARLCKTTRWHECWCPAPANHARGRRGSSTRWAPAGFYCASLYAHANADSSELFRSAATAAARVGNAPYFLCMDANVDIRGHPVLVHLLQHG